MTVTDYELDLAAKRTRLNLEAALDALPFDDPNHADISAQVSANRRYHRNKRPPNPYKGLNAGSLYIVHRKEIGNSEGQTRC